MRTNLYFTFTGNALIQGINDAEKLTFSEQAAILPPSELQVSTPRSAMGIVSDGTVFMYVCTPDVNVGAPMHPAARYRFFGADNILHEIRILRQGHAYDFVDFGACKPTPDSPDGGSYPNITFKEDLRWVILSEHFKTTAIALNPHVTSILSVESLSNGNKILLQAALDPFSKTFDAKIQDWDLPVSHAKPDTGLGVLDFIVFSSGELYRSASICDTPGSADEELILSELIYPGSDQFDGSIPLYLDHIGMPEYLRNVPRHARLSPGIRGFALLKNVIVLGDSSELLEDTRGRGFDDNPLNPFFDLEDDIPVIDEEEI